MKRSAKHTKHEKLLTKIFETLEIFKEFQQALKKMFRNRRDGLIKLSEAERNEFSKLLNKAWECISDIYINSETESSGFIISHMKYNPDSDTLEFRLSATDNNNQIMLVGYSLDVGGSLFAKDWDEMRNCMRKIL